MTNTSDNFTPKTLRELEKWMKDVCMNDQLYSVGMKPAPFEGFVLEKNGDTFEWYFTERGGKDLIRTFTNEAEACEFAFNEMKDNLFARTHLVGFFKREDLQAELVKELEQREIEYKTDQIPFQKDSPRYRVFVFNCDHKKVQDLAEKYQKLDPKARWTRS